MSVETKKKYCKIKDGPDLNTIFDALKYAREEKIIIPIDFVIVQKCESHSGEEELSLKTKNIRLRSFAYDDIKKINDYNITMSGYMDVCFNPYAMCGDNLIMQYDYCRFDAWYNTQTKDGRITICSY